jgi:spore coat protein H
MRWGAALMGAGTSFALACGADDLAPEVALDAHDEAPPAAARGDAQTADGADDAPPRFTYAPGEERRAAEDAAEDAAAERGGEHDAGALSVSSDSAAPVWDGAEPADAHIDAADELGIEDPRWPTERSALPACPGSTRAFVTPELPDPTGEVAFLRDALLEPVGYDVRVGIEIRSPSTGDVDTTATADLAVVIDGAVAALSPVPVSAGRAEVVLRFESAGTHTVVGSLPDGRSGTVQIEAFVSRLPVWELTADPAELGAVLADPGGSLKAGVAIQIGASALSGKVRLHGGSSRYSPKQSFRIDLGAGQVFADGSTHAILRAEWNDKAMLRNFLSSEVMRNGTWVPSYRAEPVHLRINQRYYGVMLRAQRVDKDFLAERGLSVDGSLYEADPPLALAVPGGNLTELASRESYPLVYQHHTGAIDYADLLDLIERTLTMPEDTFRREVTNEIAVDDVIVFLAGMAAIQNHDHVRKNYYLYRDADRDARWHLLPWDLDLTFGHLYSDEADVLDERIFTDESLYFGERVPAHDFYNQLTTRLLAVPTYRARFLSYTKHIARDVLSEEFIEGRIASFLCRATPDLLADRRKRATNEEYLSRVQEIRDFARARRAFVDAAR